MSPNPFVYRKILGPWALYVELSAAVETLPSPPDGARRVTDHVWLRVLDPAATEEDVTQLEFGIRQVAPQIEAARQGRFVVIEVSTLDYMPTDYQPEAAAAAVAQWSAREFGFPPPTITTTFDRETGYTLTWP
ncbi:hypothetical protein OG552_19220 [Streptomyces sp. NBC_01476]|uniref:hypothetical protein n=1 Tax=Streptomyces sp. NBC_01476 TaxID=2903881 RepID=UPI002E2F0BE2|nr:hypothetical protein [Streptomyces sp. NBC_01476]